MNSVPRSPESRPVKQGSGWLQTSRRSLGVVSGHLGDSRRSPQEAGWRRPRRSVWGGGVDSRTAGKPGASSGSPLGPPCDFETGAPDRSLETVTPAASSRGRQRLRHRASRSPYAPLAICQAMGGAVRTWITAG